MMRDARQTSGLFLALLALVAQLTTASVVPSAALSLATATVLCQHDGDSGGPAAPTPHHMPDCLLCFFCHNAAAPIGIIAKPPLLPVPRTVLVARAAILPPATAPPPRVVFAARPRGPPVPV